MNLKRILTIIIFFAVLGSIGAAAYQYHQRQSPVQVLQQAGKAITDKDERALAEAVDINTFIESGYDEGAALLSDHIQELHSQYPADPFFDHSSAFMQQYTADHRNQSLNFMHQVLHDYFTGPDQSLSFEDDRPQWLAAQLVKFQQSSSVSIASIEEKGDTAYATLIVAGDDSPYGQLLDKAELVLELKRTGNTWQISRIANGPALLYPAARKAEDFWTLQGWQ